MAAAKARQSTWPLKLILLVLLACLAGFVWLSHKPSQTKSAKQPPSFNKQLHSIDQTASLWVVVNKGRALPASYAPSDLVVPAVTLSESAQAENMHLRASAAAALQKMFAGAAADQIKLMLVSGYRSYATQQTVYSGYISTIGQTASDASSARPGHSEHQTGLAADVGNVDRSCELQQCFGDSPAGRWLVANASKYGFIIRYGKDQQKLTGYEYEPWHVRYVGTELAAQIERSGQTLEQFFGLPAYTDYPAKVFVLHSDSGQPD